MEAESTVDLLAEEKQRRALRVATVSIDVRRESGLPFLPMLRLDDDGHPPVVTGRICAIRRIWSVEDEQPVAALLDAEVLLQKSPIGWSGRSPGRMPERV